MVPACKDSPNFNSIAIWGLDWLRFWRPLTADRGRSHDKRGRDSAVIGDGWLAARQMRALVSGRPSPRARVAAVLRWSRRSPGSPPLDGPIAVTPQATPGCRLMKPARSSVTSIWLTQGVHTAVRLTVFTPVLARPCSCHTAECRRTQRRPARLLPALQQGIILGAEIIV